MTEIKTKEEKIESKEELIEEKAIEEEFPVKRIRKSREEREAEMLTEHISSWKPKTKLGKLVKDKKIKSIDEIFEKKYVILEPEIVDSLLRLENDSLFAGQSKGKFGGGKRRAWRQSQRKRKEGNVVTFSVVVIVGDKNGHVGFGFGKSKETLPAREKALRKAKLNIFKVVRGSGSFEGGSNEPHSIPFKVKGKCGSVTITLIPAPQGTGLAIGKEGRKILRLAGIKDIYSNSKGQTRTTINYGKAIIDALKKLK